MSHTSDLHVDLAIIGAGSAGLAALKEARKFTDRLALIEAGPLGTMCARSGCMPSKALIEWARDPRGGPGQSPFARVRELRDFFVAAAARETEEIAPHLIRGFATFVDDHTLRVNTRIIRANAILIATGSSPVVPEEWRALGRRLLSTENFFELEHVPRSLAVIGSGPVGLELGQAMAQLGVEVSIFGRDHNLAGLTDTKVRDVALDLFRRDLKLHLGAPAEVADAGRVTAGAVSVDAEYILVSAGRSPNVRGLGLEALGLPLDPRGVPVFDPATRRVGQTSIFVAGDVAGDRPVVHEAVYQGRVAAHLALRGGKNPYRAYPRFNIAFTRPNIAVVGQPPEDGAGMIIGEVDFARQGRARVMSERGGLLRIYAHAESGLISGAEMVCPAGEHLGHLLAWAIARELTIAEMLELPFYHPTLEEGVRTALVGLNTASRGSRKS